MNVKKRKLPKYDFLDTSYLGSFGFDAVTFSQPNFP